MRNHTKSSRRFTTFLIFMLISNTVFSPFLSVVRATTSTESLIDELYFTKKDQNERINELNLEEQTFSIDLVLENATDQGTEIELPDGILINEESLSQEGLTYEEQNQKLIVDWSKFIGEQKKRVSLSFTTNSVENVNIQAKTVRDEKEYFSNKVKIVPMMSITEEPSVDSEIKDQEKPIESKEEDNKGVESIESKEEDNKDVKSIDQTTTKNSLVTSLSQAEISAGFDINHVDTYGISWEAPGIIYQFDGNNPSATPKASLTVRGVAADKFLNGLALSKYNNRFYASSGSELYLIDSGGASLKVTNLLGPTGNGVMSGDGTKYYYSYGQGGKVSFASYDITSGQHESIEVKGLASNVSSLGGDLLVDANGLIWFTQGNRLIQFDPTDGNVILNTELPTDDPEAAGRGLSFLPDGRMLIAGGLTNDSAPKLFVYNPQLHEITYLGSMTKGPVIVDLASAITPSFKPPAPGELKVIKEDAEDGTRLTGAIFELKDTDDNKAGELVTDENGEAILQDLEAGNYTLVETVAPEGYELKNEAIKVTIENDKPTVITIKNTKIEEPIDPPDACAAPVALQNGSFEEPVNNRKPLLGVGYPDAPHGIGAYFYAKDVPGWSTTATDDAIQIHRYEDFAVPVKGLTAAHGNQVAELNAHQASMLYQDVDTTPGQKIYWRVSHLGYMGGTPGVGEDEMHIKIGAPGSDLKVEGVAKTSNVAWKQYSGEYIVPAGQTKTRFGFEAVKSASGSIVAGNIIDDVFLGTEACVTGVKTVSPEGDVFAGDELTYEMTVKNSGGDIAANTVIEDAIPVGTEYVPGSMKILNGPKAGDLTDVEDSDAGHHNGDKVIFKLGDLPNTTTLPEGITVQFKVKALSSHAGKDVDNKAQVKYKDLLTDGEKEIETNEVKTPIKHKAPVLKSEKSATIKEKADGNKDADNPEVGDTLLYTIKTQNTIADSLVTNLTITDKIPKGLAYVSDSLQVDGKSVTDTKDTDNGHHVDGTVTGAFGDIADTDWHTLTFEVKVQAGQAGMDIKNIATVTGENIDEPDKPEEEVKIYPRDPRLESEKSATNVEKDKQKFEVGDTILYTIKTRNKVSDGIVENLTITDKLPVGLEYVENSLEVSHNGKGAFDNGTVTAEFGDVTDTEWHTVTFQAKVKLGQAGQKIQNTALVDGDNINEPDEPTTTVEILPADMKLTKKVNQSKANVGDIITYTIEAENGEKGGLWNGVIQDQLPAHVELVKDSTKLNGTALSDADVWDKDELTVQPVIVKAGEKAVITFQVKVLDSALNTTVKNIATAYDPNEPDESDNRITTPPTETIIVPTAGELESIKAVFNADSKAIDGQKVKVGDQLTYKITVENIKDVTTIVNNVKVIDDIPVGLSYVPGTLTVNGKAKDDGAVNGQVVTVDDIGSLKGGERVEVAFVVHVTKDAKGEITNIATVEGTVPGKTPDEPEEPVEPKNPETDVKLPADITLTKTVNKAKANIGDIVTFTIEAKNGEKGGPWNGTIQDQLPAHVELVKDSTKLNGNGLVDADVWKDNQLSVSPVALKAGEKAVITFQVKVLDSALNTIVENIATAYDPDQPGDPNEPGKDPENPVKTPPTKTEILQGAGELATAKTVLNTAGDVIDGQQVKVGDQITYQITAENVKDATTIVNDVKIVDKIPTGLTYVPGTMTVNGQVKDDRVVDGQNVTIDDIGSLKGGEKVVVAFTVKVTKDAAGKVTNIATVTGKVPAEVPGDPDQPVDPQNPEVSIENPADITFTKIVNQETAYVGDIVTYTITAENGEKGGPWNGTIEDKLPAHVERVKDSTKLNGNGLVDADVWKDNQLSLTPVALKAGEKAVITFQVKVLDSALNTTVENIATAYDPDQPGDPSEPGKDPKNPMKTSPAKTKVISLEKGSNPVVPEEKQKQKLPQTGEKQTGYMIVIGVLLIGVALIGFLKKRKSVAK